MAYIWKMAFKGPMEKLQKLDEAVRALSGQKKYRPVVEAWTRTTENGLVPPAVQKTKDGEFALLAEVEIPQRSAAVREAVEGIFDLVAELEAVCAGYEQKNVLKDTNSDTFFPGRTSRRFTASPTGTWKSSTCAMAPSG